MKTKMSSSYNLKTLAKDEGSCRLVRVNHLPPSANGDPDPDPDPWRRGLPLAVTVRKSAANQHNRIWICQSQSEIWFNSKVKMLMNDSSFESIKMIDFEF